MGRDLGVWGGGFGFWALGFRPRIRVSGLSCCFCWWVGRGGSTGPKP